MKNSFEDHRPSTPGAAIKRANPAAETRGPQTKICNYNLRWPLRSNRPRRKQDQAELRLRRFPLAQNRVGDFADQRESDRGGIIALHVHEGLDQFALVDANQLPSFPLKIPDANIGEYFQGRAKPIFGKPRAARNAAHPAGLAIEKADQTVALAERISAQNNRLRLLEWHSC